MKTEKLSDTITIINADCREWSGNADAVISDPPYGMDWPCNMTSMANRVGCGGRDWGMEIAGDKEPFDPTPWLNFPAVVLWGVNHFAARIPVGTTLVWIKRLDPAFGTFFLTQNFISLINTLIQDTEREYISEKFLNRHKIQIPGIQNLRIESLDRDEKFVSDDLELQLMIRMDLTCLNADDPNMTMLGFAFFEQIGIYLLEPDDYHVFISEEAHKKRQLNKMRFVMNELETT